MTVHAPKIGLPIAAPPALRVWIPTLLWIAALCAVFGLVFQYEIRGAVRIWNESTALLARQHNDANVCAIGARQHTLEEATHLIDLFLAEPFGLRPGLGIGDRRRYKFGECRHSGLGRRPERLRIA